MTNSKNDYRLLRVISDAYWHDIARACARVAAEHHCAKRRGVWDLKAEGVFVIYNNNPYASDPALRDEETARLRALLEAESIGERAHATYPETGEEAGYTCATVLDTTPTRKHLVRRLQEQVTLESIRRLIRSAGSRDGAGT